MKKKTISVVLMLSVALLALTLGCAEPAPEAKTVKIGLNIPLSGPVAYWGMTMQQAYILAAEDINAAGGVKIGDDTYMIELISYDAKNTVADARAGATRLIFVDKVKYIVSQAAAASIGTQEISEPEEVLFMTANWGYIELISPDYFFSFRSEMSDYESGFASYPWMLENYPEIKTVAFIGPDDADGYATYYSHQRLTEYYGLESVTFEYFEWETVDFYPLVTKVLAANPDMLDLSPVPPGITALIVKASREMGFTGPIHSPAALESKTIIEIAGEYATDVILPMTMEDPQTDIQKEVVAKAIAKFGEFNALTGNYYHWLFSLKQAWETAGTVEDTRAVAIALGNSVLYDTFLGTVKYAGENIYGINRQSIYDVPITLIKDGVAVLVDVRFPELPPEY